MVRYHSTSLFCLIVYADSAAVTIRNGGGPFIVADNATISGKTVISRGIEQYLGIPFALAP